MYIRCRILPNFIIVTFFELGEVLRTLGLCYLTVLFPNETGRSSAGRWVFTILGDAISFNCFTPNLKKKKKSWTTSKIINTCMDFYRFLK